jgi:hypothetical protein
MARINKSDHAIILRKVEVDECKISEVAAEYGCSAANLYALLRKLRRAGVMPAAAEPEPEAPEAAGLPAGQADKAAADLFAAGTPAKPLAKLPAKPASPPMRPPAPIAAAPPRPTAEIVPMPKGGRSGIGLALAKPGYALAMRGPEGDENLTPFRSLDDLLSAVKPILRAAARNPEAIWFSIQPIDLASLDSFGT